MRSDSLGISRACVCGGAEVGGMNDPLTAVSAMAWIFIAALGYGFYRLVS